MSLLLVSRPGVRPWVFEQTTASGPLVSLTRLYVILGILRIQKLIPMDELIRINTVPSLVCPPTLHIWCIVLGPAVL